MLYYIFILHQTTTGEIQKGLANKLYYIFILHQTTTQRRVSGKRNWLYYIFILHQTTTLQRYALLLSLVVLYLHSTSNHNLSYDEPCYQ